MLRHAYYHASIRDFLTADTDSIVGQLTLAHGFSLEPAQRDAWVEEIRVLKEQLSPEISGFILFEFYVPRVGKRVDTVLFFGESIVVLEFKVGAKSFDRGAMDQVYDYALDLKNFHRGSHNLDVVPAVIATAAPAGALQKPRFAVDRVAEPIKLGAQQVGTLLEPYASRQDLSAAFGRWLTSGYQPTPTIIEAAQALYQLHGVEEIARSDAGAINLGMTTACIERIIEDTKANGAKAICLVTGVPGAGKTLAGLNIATRRQHNHSSEHAVFLSGNGPLVTVLREALARDNQGRSSSRNKKDALRQISSFIQNIHHFRDDVLGHDNAPAEKVIIYDEAQRAWTREQASKFMQSKRGVSDFDMSEPELLLGAMDRHDDWCVVICLIGGGQEINTGEAGLPEWVSTLAMKFSHWNIYISSRLKDPEYVGAGDTLTQLRRLRVTHREELHLAVSMRSFRAETLSTFIGHVVDNRPDEARLLYNALADRYPIFVTRSLPLARSWIVHQARGTERFGLLASSGALRLRPEGIHVKAKIDAPSWFLNGRADVRSSYYLEDVGTEFDVQGLELDWSVVCWDADYRHTGTNWSHFRFRGTRWEAIVAPDRRNYLKNAYRVILTRARQGMVIFVPLGSNQDSTRSAEYYDRTYGFLRQCGLVDLSDR